MRNILLSLLFTCLVSLPLIAQLTPRNMSLVSRLSYPDEVNEIWGYTSPTGQEYALLGLRTGVSIVNLSDPFNPEESDFLPGIYSPWRDIKTHGNFAYVSNESGDGLRIIDLSALPGKVSFKDSTFADHTTAHNLYIDDGFLYVLGSDIFNGGVVVFDLNPDPWNPEFKGAYDLRYVHDAYVRDKIAYTAEISARRLSIVDLSDPSKPELLGQLAYEGAFTHNTWLNDEGTVCFTTDEYGAAYVHAWDISDPGNIRLLDRIRSSQSQGESIPHNTHVLDDFLINSYYRDGIQIVDASRPHNLIEVGYYDTSDTLSGTGFNGSWGAYPFLPSGLILASDIENGLYVLDPSYVRGCYLEGTVRDFITQNELSDVKISILNQNIFDQSQDNGSYATGIGVAGSYQVVFSKFGYEPDTQQVSLQNGVLTQLDVNLLSLNRITLQIEVKDAETGAAIPDAQIQGIAVGSGIQINYLTNGDGLLTDPRLVINPYQLVVGKWGYITQSVSIQPSQNDTSLSFFLEKGYYDDFSLDFGWEVSGTASKGTWEIAEPDGTYRKGNIYAPEFDLADDIGDQAFVTDNQDNGAFGYDVDNGFTQLISPWMDLSGMNGPIINYHYWFVNWTIRDGIEKPANDFLSVSITDGIDTIDIKRYEGPFDTTWTEESRFFFQKYFDIEERPLRVIFYVQDFSTDNQDAVEAAIDGFRVVETRPTSRDRLWEQAVNLSFYPIPVDQRLHLHLELPPEDIGTVYILQLLDFRGRTLLSRSLSPLKQDYSLDFDYPAGMYLGQILRNGNIVGSRKIIK